ncbi:hypothetical protein CPB84DRAFT_1847170 [Gymnopilus junonius]|uniref:F-box domain-containing protein n=1 Tax=Gymnopilus junonius TaxID=109634 RepID=A0A9P5TND6_GYMJU|nr:hypothetical protein CPB84DRAFT_1847170 [Gymnopilus junonius]
MDEGNNLALGPQSVSAMEGYGYDENEFMSGMNEQRPLPCGPPRKRAWVSNAKDKKEKEKEKASQFETKDPPNLDFVPTLPLEILFEIFKFLDPKELISLSRTTLAFRHTLIAHTTASLNLWKAARQRQYAPEPPQGISEVA